MTETKDKRKPTAKSKPDTLVKALIAFHETRPTASQNASGVWGTYADINQVIDTVRGACQFGLTFTQEIDFLDHNPQVNYIRTILMHESGESQVSRTKQDGRKKTLAKTLPDKQPKEPETPQSNPNAWAQQ